MSDRVRADAVPEGHLVERAGLLAQPIGQAQDDAEDDEHDRHDPERAERRADGALREVAENDDRHGADDDEPTETHVGVVLCDTVRMRTAAAAERPEPAPDDARNVFPEVDDHRGFGAELRDRGERRPRVGVRRQELAHDAQVGARGDREELGQALDQAEDDRLDKAHGCPAVSSVPRCRG
jgi:hypothetical protein